MYKRRNYNRLQSEISSDEFSPSDDNNSSSYVEISKSEENRSFLKSTNNDVNKDIKLKRNVGVCDGVSIVVGAMIGSGIFIVPTGVLRHCNGDMSLSILIWVLGGLITILVALCYCELGTLIPESGGVAPYLKTIYGNGACFVYLWIILLTAIPQGSAVQIIALGDYILGGIAVGLGLCLEDFPPLFSKLVGLAITFLILTCNMTNVRLAVKLQVWCTVGKVAALIIISIAGFYTVISDSTILKSNFYNQLKKEEEAVNVTIKSSVTNALWASVHTSPGISGLSLAVFQSLWAYDGFDTITCITEEVKKPKKTLPLVIIASLFIVLTLYLVVNISYFAVLTEKEMLSSDAVAVSFAAKVHPWLSYVVTFAVCLSLIGSMNITFLSAGRMPFVAGRMGFMPEILSMIHVKYFTPAPALLFVMSLTIVMILPSNIDMLLKGTMFTVWGVRIFCALGVLILRRKLKHAERPYEVHKLTAVLAMLVCTYIVVVPLVFNPQALYVLTFALIVLYSGVYCLLKKEYFSMRGVGRFTSSLQKLLLVTAPAIEG